MVPELPQEIIDYILDLVEHQHNSKTLQSCALVARSFLPTSRKRIFSSVKLRLQKGFYRVRRFIRLSKHTPHLFLLVASLDISLHDLRWNHHTIHVFFREFLARLTNLHAVSVILVNMAPWSTYSPVTHRVLSDALALPAVTSVTLGYFMFNDPSQLEELTDTCNEISFKRTTIGVIGPPGSWATQSVKRLRVDPADQDIFNKLASLGRWRALKSLIVDSYIGTYTSAKQHYLQELLDSCTELEECYIRLHCVYITLQPGVPSRILMF
ncbi:hypothetical protein MKEN_00737000 [Mycena kentingensis (nom. inval.)]|nr:hypothetical protein MKEN_00737000 [Mycena kentingensis (nom. inval.)]